MGFSDRSDGAKIPMRATGLTGLQIHGTLQGGQYVLNIVLKHKPFSAVNQWYAPWALGGGGRKRAFPPWEEVEVARAPRGSHLGRQAFRCGCRWRQENTDLCCSDLLFGLLLSTIHWKPLLCQVARTEVGSVVLLSSSWLFHSFHRRICKTSLLPSLQGA